MSMHSDMRRLGLTFALFLILFVVVFHKQDFVTVFKTVVAFHWLLVLPGFFLSYQWDFDFPERYVISVPLSAALVGIGAYYLGLLGVHLEQSIILLPIFLILTGLKLNSEKLRNM